jgi:glutathione S-transferase
MLTLYYSPGACSLGPQILLEEAAIDCQRRCIPMAENAHLTAEYLAINPRARVPALEIDGRVVTEGPAIMAYLATLKPDRGFLPTAGSLAFAESLEWMAWLSSSLHISYGLYWRPERFLPDGVENTLVVDKGLNLIKQQNLEIEDRLVGAWVLGNQYSIADCYLFAFYRWGVRIGLPMARLYPRWTAWTDAMLGRAAVQRAIAVEGIGTDWRQPTPK